MEECTNARRDDGVERGGGDEGLREEKGSREREDEERCNGDEGVVAIEEGVD